MPQEFLPPAQVEPDRLEDALSAAPSGGLAFSSAFGPLTARAADAARDRRWAHASKLSAEEANERFGVEGHLTFNEPVSEHLAAARQRDAQRRAFRDEVLSRSSPLTAVGASLTGALLDPVALPLIFAPELLGVRGAIEGVMAARAGAAGLKAGRLAGAGRGALIGGVEGIAGGVIYESANYGLARYMADDDYELGDALASVAVGGVLGAGIGGALGGAVGGRPRPPRAVRDLPEDARVGAQALALDAVIEDAPVKLDAPLQAELRAAQTPREALEAVSDQLGPGAIPARLLEDSVAVTTRGTEVPVRYALVELDALVTSHDDDLARNPAFPEALQPRDRSRAGSQAGNLRLEAELNPKRLMRESGAETGAPLIAPDGTVESGNGRTIALRRSARTGSEAYERYKAELAAQGFDVSGMERPVLVRVRANSLSGEERAALAREMNAAPTEAYGPAEQAMADAASLDDAMLAQLDGTPQGLRAFARSFLAKVAPDQQNAMADAAGGLSAVGQSRIKAALVARAYGEPRLVEALFEAADPNIKTMGQALADAAPSWAKMRSLAARGEIPVELDVTPQLRAAVDLVRHARDNRIPLDELIAERLDQTELFGGQAIDVETEAFLRLMFRDGAFKRHRSADKIAWALNDYARQAAEVTPGPNLFGDVPDGDARLILQGLSRRFADDAAFPADGDLEGLIAAKPAPAAGADLQPARVTGDGPRPGGVGPQAGAGAEGEGLNARPDALAGVDEELRALADEDLADEDLAQIPPAQDPATIAEAMRAAAFCLSDGAS